MSWDSTKVRRHPYNKNESIPPHTKVLIIGTCPPPRFECPSDDGPLRDDDFDFYYGSRDNQLWSCLFKEIFEENFPAEFGKRRGFLRSSGIWMHDILNTYKRKANSSKDSDLERVCCADITNILRDFKEIDRLVCTGRHAEKWTRERMMDQNLIEASDWPTKMPFGKCYRLTINLDDELRDITVCTWLSPVRRTLGRNRQNIPLYRKFLVNAVG
jgi:G:T/U-mismatch repair DNA glycosylase